MGLINADTSTICAHNYVNTHQTKPIFTLETELQVRKRSICFGSKMCYFCKVIVSALEDTHCDRQPSRYRDAPMLPSGAVAEIDYYSLTVSHEQLDLCPLGCISHSLSLPLSCSLFLSLSLPLSLSIASKKSNCKCGLEECHQAKLEWQLMHLPKVSYLALPWFEQCT